MPFSRSELPQFCYVHFYCVILLASHVQSQRRQEAPDLPSHLPSPPEPSAGTGELTTAGVPLEVPPQNIPPGPLGPVGPVGPLPPPPPPILVPFGLDHIILIMVPQFKCKFTKLPKWLGSSVKVAMPITVFFDKLVVPPALALALAPFGSPPFPPPGLPPPGIPPGLLPPGIPPGSLPPDPTEVSLMENYGNGYYPYTGAYPYAGIGDEDDDDDSDTTDEMDDGDGYKNEDDDSVDNYEPYEEGEYRYAKSKRKRRRRKRYIHEVKSSGLSHETQKAAYTLPEDLRVRQKRTIPFNKTIHATERAVLIPRIENMLESSGLGGKDCLLRTVCEVHEAPLHHYGLMGQLLTLFFSVSRSTFAESHLADYLRAEKVGKTGDCSEYWKLCKRSMFSWEE